MTLPQLPPSTGSQTPSVEDAKRALTTWGNETGKRAETLRSQVGTGASRLAVGGLITVIVLMTARRIIAPRVSRSTHTSRSSIASRSSSHAGATHAPRAAKVGAFGHIMTLARRLALLGAARAGHLILPHVVNFARTTVANAVRRKPKLPSSQNPI